jgi:flagellar basal body-associated protein FliL
MSKPTKPKDLKPDEAAGGAPPVPAAGGGGLDLKFIITILAIVLFSIGSSVGAIYFLGPMVLVPAIVAQMPKPEPAEGAEGEPGEEAGGHGGGGHTNVGLTLELDEFTANLKADPALRGTQYVRTKVALSVSVPEPEDCTKLMHPTASAQLGSRTLAMGAGVATINAVAKITALQGGTLAGAAAPLDDVTVEQIRQESSQQKRLASGGSAASPYDTCLTTFKHNMAIYVPTIRDIINSALMKRTSGNLESVEGQEALKDEIKDQINQLLGEERKVIRVNFQDFIIQR